MTRYPFHAARDTFVSGGKLDDPDEDWTNAHLPELPCRRCGDHPLEWPHSICRNCIEQARGARNLRRLPTGVAGMEPWDQPTSGEIDD